jgi:hypothetical protein
MMTGLFRSLWRLRRFRLIRGEGVPAELYFEGVTVPDSLKGAKVYQTPDGPVIAKSSNS